MFASEKEFVVYEEFTSENEEENNTRNHFGCVFVEVKVGGYLYSAFVKKYEEKRNEYHCKGVEF